MHLSPFLLALAHPGRAFVNYCILRGGYQDCLQQRELEREGVLLPLKESIKCAKVLHDADVNNQVHRPVSAVCACSVHGGDGWIPRSSQQIGTQIIRMNF